MKTFQNILIIRTDRIGDVVLTTPVIKALRQKFPSTRLSILVTPATQDLVQGHPDLDEVLIDDRCGRHKGLGYFRLVGELRRRRFDLAINFHTKKRSNMLCFLAGIPHRIGYRNEKFGFLLNHPIPDTRPQGIKHEAQYCLDVLRPLGISDGKIQTFVPLQKENESWAERFFMENRARLTRPVVAIHPGASCPTKQWPIKYFVEVMRQLAQQRKASFILVGTADQKFLAEEILRQLKGVVLNLIGQTSVGQLASLLKRCNLLISNDSGPVHVADGVGTRVVSIFTRNQPGINPERWRPLGSRSRWIAPPSDSSISFAQGRVSDPQYLELIQSQEVLAVVDEVLNLC